MTETREQAVGEGKPGRKLKMHLPVFLGFVLFVLLIGAMKVWGPMGTNRRQQEELARLRREKAALQAESKELTEYKRLLASDQGLESAARREGYLRQGDRRIVFVPEKGSGAQQKGPGAGGQGPANRKGPGGKPETPQRKP